MLFFWDINQVLNPDDVINNPKQTTKYYYISIMRSQLTEIIITIFNERMQELIFKRYTELAEAHNEKIK